MEQYGGEGMKIYVVCAGHNYEEYDIFLITNSLDIALLKKEELEKPEDDGNKRYHYVEIQEHKLVTK